MEASNDEIVLSDQLIIERLKKHMRPDENELYYIFGQEVASIAKQGALWALGGIFLAGALSTKNFFIGLTEQRLLFLHVSLTYEEKSLEFIEIPDIAGAKIEEAPMEKDIHILLRTGKKYTFKVKKRMSLVTKQEENLEKICQFLTVA